MVGYNVQKDAMLPEETFDPTTGEVNRVDHGMKRWIRGYKKKFALNTFDVLYSLAALSTAGLGIYAAVIGKLDSVKDHPHEEKSTNIAPQACTKRFLLEPSRHSRARTQPVKCKYSISASQLFGRSGWR